MGTASIHKHSHKPPVYNDCTGLVLKELVLHVNTHTCTCV